MIRGGLRTRLVIDSVRVAVISALQQAGWFDPTVHDTPPGSRHHQPFRYISRPVEWSAKIEANAIAIGPEDIADDPYGFGGEVQDVNDVYVDLFAEDDSLGWQVTYDLRDSLLGKTANGIGPQIDVYDFRQPTPAPFTTVDVDLIEIDRSQGEARTWQRHWFMTHVVLLDEYGDEFPEVPVASATDWTTVNRQSWERVQQAEQVP
jgi:hypothetical protein